jgi:hypothetical protein
MLNEDELLDRLRRLLKVSGDPRLHDAIWSYREGKLSRMELFTHPAYERHMLETMEAAVAELGRRGRSLAEVQALTRRLAREHGFEEAIPDED